VWFIFVVLWKFNLRTEEMWLNVWHFTNSGLIHRVPIAQWPTQCKLIRVTRFNNLTIGLQVGFFH
jgi:hypothetical protein